MLWLVIVLGTALAATLLLLFRTRRQVPAPAGRETHLEQLFETFPHALALRDYEGRLLRANAEFTRLFQYSLPEVLGVNIDRLLRVPGAEKTDGVDRVLSSAGKIWRQTRRRRRDGSVVDVSHTGAPLSAGTQVPA